MAADPLLKDAHVLVEPGRWLAGPVGLYIGQVRAVKQSRGQRFVVMDGGMHHHLAASGNLGQVIKRDYPIIAPGHLDQPVKGETQLVGPSARRSIPSDARRRCRNCRRAISSR